MSSPATSPCTNICQLDDQTGWCFGCGRTGDEIANWLSLSPEERIALKRELPTRLAAMDRDISADRS